MKRRVRRGEGKIKKQRCLRIVLVDARNRVSAEQLRHIAFFLDRLVITVPIPDVARRMREVIDLAQHRQRGGGGIRIRRAPWPEIDDAHTAEQRLFGKDDDAGNVITPGVFTRAQVGILAGFSAGTRPLSDLAALFTGRLGDGRTPASIIGALADLLMRETLQ